MIEYFEKYKAGLIDALVYGKHTRKQNQALLHEINRVERFINTICIMEFPQPIEKKELLIMSKL